VKYWLVKGKPGEFKGVMRNIEQTWRTAKRLPPREEWRKDDTLIMWAKAPKCRVVAFAELVHPIARVGRRYSYFATRYRTDLFEGPTIDELRRLKALRAAYFLKAGPSQTVYPLADAEGIVISRLAEERRTCGSAKSARPSGAEERAVNRLLGAGFGSPEENRRVEKVAVDAATANLEVQGWRVVSREREKVGYDLDCSKGSRRMRVEVKGVRGGAPSFILTAGEYRRYCEDPAFALCVVTSALTAPHSRLVTGDALDNKLAVLPLAYKARLLA